MMDPIADMLTRIRNAAMAKKKEVLVPYSKIKFEIAKILQKENFLASVELSEDNTKMLVIGLKYIDSKSAISSIKRISTVGRRLYIKHEEIKPVLNGFGTMVVSTSRGIMTGREAKRVKVGGEVICEVY
jgi:small subunit ribosomal protein S8